VAKFAVEGAELLEDCLAVTMFAHDVAAAFVLRVGIS
jgi:hypothetical protein